MSDTANFEALGHTAIGEELSINECKVLASIMKVRHLKEGERLVTESGAEKTLFVLLKGELAVIAQRDNRPQVVYTMKPGEVAGTRAFVDRSPRKATLEAVGSAEVYTLDPHDFESLLDSQPRILYKVMRSLFKLTHSNLLRMNQESEQLSNYISRSHGRY
ncbi:MAG: cyclic nucleotide-binding domain-containing protein [Gammaproteobacteria bacterium]|nr:cyclic nucleotide-binding domain-containing protein [Gammaproteobacteria bacterium]MCF6231066.1 cyclic nucleotide-binding domain-containing protein [Gammaproteobacteria bacterium]